MINWNKLSGWQKGALIGLVVDFILVIYIVQDWNKLSEITGNPLMTYFKGDGLKALLFVSFYPSFCGGIIGKVHTIIWESEVKNKLLRFLAFSIISGLFFFFVGMGILIAIAKPY